MERLAVAADGGDVQQMSADEPADRPAEEIVRRPSDANPAQPAKDVPDDQQAIYRRAFINLPFTNGDESWELPTPATYILDRDATILYRSANEDYTERPEPSEILERLR